VRGESLDDYGQFLDRVIMALQPQDIFEEVWARQAVDQVWEAQRWRRCVADLVTLTQQEALVDVLRQLTPNPIAVVKAPQLAKEYFLGDKKAIDEVDRLLESAGLTWDVITAKALALRIEEVDRFSSWLTKAEARLAATLREIERHRTTFGKQLRAALAIESKAEPSPTLEVQNTEERLNGNNAQD
jgi:dsDNA-binding SOS-regulon protein